MNQNLTNSLSLTTRTVGTKAAALLAALALAGCVAAPVVPPVATAPVTSTAPVPRPANPYPTQPRIVAPAPAPVTTTRLEPAAPAAPSFSGGIDGRTGMRQSSVVAVTGDASRGYTVLFRPKDTEAASVEAAPGKLCGASGVASSRTNAPGAGSAMPGVQIMIVKCNTAA